jgi:UDP-galactopyranose mutase
MKYDYLIVGAGLAGCVLAERIASQLNKKVLLIDRRSHIAGNCYDYYDDSGVLVHKYGPHIFHTSSQKVWNYLSQFTEWIPYEHKVLAVIEGKKVPVPFNLNSLKQIFPEKEAKRFESLLLEKYSYGLKVPILKLIENTEPELKFLADFIYKNIFYGYTVKQWGLEPKELDFSVTSRVPVLIGHDDRYFHDTHQGIPRNGYTELFKKIIEHKNIEVFLNTDYQLNNSNFIYDKLIYTGPIDEFFDYSFGKLPYRSLEFDFVTVKQEWFQEVAQVNYPNDFDYTRITEFKHFSRQKLPITTNAYEYPKAYIHGVNEPYYPIQRKENDDLYNKYKAEANKLKDSVLFIGRLADYKYYNMDQIVGVALMTFEKQIVNEK